MDDVIGLIVIILVALILILAPLIFIIQQIRKKKYKLRFWVALISLLVITLLEVLFFRMAFRSAFN